MSEPTDPTEAALYWKRSYFHIQREFDTYVEDRLYERVEPVIELATDEQLLKELERRLEMRGAK